MFQFPYWHGNESNQKIAASARQRTCLSDFFDICETSSNQSGTSVATRQNHDASPLIGCAGCGTQKRKLATEHFENTIAHNLPSRTSSIFWRSWLFFWPSYGQRETQICCPHYILTSLPVLSTTLRTKPNHVHNRCLQTFLCYKCVSRVMVNVDSIFFPQTFAWNGSYEMSMCLRPRSAHEVRDKYWGAAFFLQILAWDWSCEMSVRSSTLQARTRCGSRSWGMVQGTDNVVPTGCRMPELAAEKLT